MTGWAVPGLVHVREVRVDAVGRRVIARHRMNRRAVSVTYLSPQFVADAEFRDRFTIEVERLAQVRDASVARVHQYVECGDHAAVVADHVEGTPLRALLLEEGAIGTEAAVVVFTDALRGVAAGHAAGLVHGDLKPEYVVLTPTGRVRLVDFGLFTRTGRRLLARSTPFYLAPEQWNGGPATTQADLYAATVTFFECLVGAPPFHADSPAVLSVLHERSAPPLEALPGPVRELVRSGLAKDPAARPSARDLLTQVEEAAAEGLGPGWERRGRRELSSLLAKPSHPADLPVVPVPSGYAGRVRQVRLAAVLGGALVVAVGLSSPPFPSVLVPGSDELVSPDEAMPPVMAFPGTSNGTAGTSSTEGESAPPKRQSESQSAALAAPQRPSTDAEPSAPVLPLGPAGSRVASSADSEAVAVDRGLPEPSTPASVSSAPASPAPRTVAPPHGVEPSAPPAVPATAPAVPATAPAPSQRGPHASRPADPESPEPSKPQRPKPRVARAALPDAESAHRQASKPQTYSGDARGASRTECDERHGDDTAPAGRGTSGTHR